MAKRNPIDLIEIPCPICGTRPFRRAHTVRDRLSHTRHQGAGEKSGPQEATYNIVACSSCGLLYLNPRPSADTLQTYYKTEAYDPHRRSGGGLTGYFFRLVRPCAIRWKASRVARSRNPGKLLDIGCGTGEFLDYMSSIGWTVFGVENDAEAAGTARSFGHQVVVRDPAEVDLPDTEFDLITFWHSLEHLPHLQETADRISSLMKPGGILAIAVPNPDSLDARFYRSRWAAWDAPRHLYHFRFRDLDSIWAGRGFRWIKSYSLPLDPFYHALLSEISWTSGVNAIWRGMRGLCLGSLSFIAGMKAGKGSSVLYIFEKT